MSPMRPDLIAIVAVALSLVGLEIAGAVRAPHERDLAIAALSPTPMQPYLPAIVVKPRAHPSTSGKHHVVAHRRVNATHKGHGAPLVGKHATSRPSSKN